MDLSKIDFRILSYLDSPMNLLNIYGSTSFLSLV